MTDDILDYGKLIDDAMHYVVKRSLEIISEGGLENDHHFFITFDTTHSGVMMSNELLDKYPNEMTIVVQHQFWDLEITDKDFSIVLSFENVRQNLTVPFSSLISFSDPSVKFGLQFHVSFDDEELSMIADDGTSLGKEGNENNVVSLDSFREDKKK